MADVDHTAAQEFCTDKWTRIDEVENLKRAYIDLRAQIAERDARIAMLDSALRVFVEKYEAAPDGDLGIGLTNGDFFRARDVTNSTTK